MEAKDFLVRRVCAGDRVRVLGLSEAFVKSLPPDEHAKISEMIGTEFEVEQIDEAGDFGGGDTDCAQSGTCFYGDGTR